MAELLELRDKLDTTLEQVAVAAVTVSAVGGAVNGPEGGILDWDAIDWRAVEDDVRRLRQRIFTASQAGDLKRVRNLQKLMLRCRSNALLSVRRVTEVNAGRKTAGVDGRTVWPPRTRPNWPPGCHATGRRGHPGRSSGYG
jgi:RNA-directed DNA polymerase